jgi:hypothetical protein
VVSGIIPISPHQLLATIPTIIMANPAAIRKILSELPIFFNIVNPPFYEKFSCENVVRINLNEINFLC